jgi:ribosome-binding factor A
MKPVKRNFKRTDRIADQIQKEVADLLKNEVSDPRVAWVTITHVDVTRDYSHAKLFYTIMPGMDKVEADKGLVSISGFLRSHLGKRLTLFATPQLHFVYDVSMEYGHHMSNLLAKIGEDDAKIREGFEENQLDEPTLQPTSSVDKA